MSSGHRAVAPSSPSRLGGSLGSVSSSVVSAAAGDSPSAASSAALSSRSACALRARGTHLYVMCPRGMVRLASSASDCSAEFLIFHRPDICSTTSFESSLASTTACGSIPAAASSPAIKPRYSATLFVVMPSVCATSASTSPVAASRTTAPYAAGPGLPRAPPSASTTSRRPLTAPTRPCAPESAGTPRIARPRLAPQHESEPGRPGRW